MTDVSVEPKNTYAMIVGIEKYNPSFAADLNGPARDARSFADWLCNDREVPYENIALFLSPIDDNKSSLESWPGPHKWSATSQAINDFINQKLHHWPGRLLYIFWGGHGITTEDRTRRLFYANTTSSDLYHLNFQSLSLYLASHYISFQQQIFIIDSCANYQRGFDKGLTGTTFKTGNPAQPPRKQFIFFASHEGEAARNNSQQQTGLFSNMILEELKKVPPTPWPPDMQELAEKVVAHFEAINKLDATSRQRPKYIVYRDGNGLTLQEQPDTFKIGELKDYLEKFISFLTPTLSYYPPNFDFAHIHQRVNVSKKRLPYQEQVALREMLRRAGYSEEEEMDQKALEWAYQWRGSEMYEQLRKTDIIVDWDKIREQVERIVVLGDPGFGKSWLLLYEGRKVAREQLALLQQGKWALDKVIFPIHISLTTLARKLDKSNTNEQEVIVNILKDDYDLTEGFLAQVRQWLKASHCLLLLDGLDEVVDEQQYELVKEALKRLAKNTGCRMILTSRIVGYRGLPFPMQIGTRELEQEVELVAFSWEQVVSFIKNWFTEDHETGIWLRETLRREPVLRSLARIPLLLSFLCSVSAVDKDVPTHRANLYEKMLRRLLGGLWREQKQDSGRLEKKLVVLEHIAWHFATSDEGWRDLLPGDKLSSFIQKIPADERPLEIDPKHSLLWELSEQDGILVKAGASGDESEVPYRFIHRTFHEYLVAHYLSKQPSIWLKMVKKHLWFDPDWEVVILLLAGCLEDPNPLLEMLFAEPYDAFHTLLLLAGRSLAETNRTSVESDLAEQIIQRLLILLHSISQQERIRAMQVIGQVHEKRAVSDLQAVLLEKSHGKDLSNLRSASAEALSQIGDLQAIKRLLEVFQNKDIDTEVRELAADAVGMIGDPRMIDDLLAILRDKREQMWWERKLAAEALGRIGDPRAMEDLLIALRDEAMNVRWKAAEALGRIGDPRAIEDLLQALQDEPTVSHAVQNSLYSIGGPQVFQGLQSIMQGENEDVRWKAADVLGRIGGPQIIQLLLSVLQDKNQHLRMIVAGALEQISDKEAVEPLLKVLQDKNEYWQTRSSVAKALGSIGDPRAVAGLLTALKEDETWEVRAEAARALGRIGDVSAVEGLMSALRNNESDARRATRRIIIHTLNVPGVVVPPPDEKGDVREAASKALVQIGEPQAIEVLLAALQDEDEHVRSATAQALKQVGDPQVVKPLQTALLADLQGSTTSRRHDVVETLGYLDTPQVREALRIALGDPDKEVSDAAAEALGRLGDKEAIKVLLTTLYDKVDWGRSTHAATALGEICEEQAILPLLTLLPSQGWLSLRPMVKALRKLSQCCNPLVYCVHVFRMWMYNPAISNILYELLILSAPRLHAEERLVWKAWRSCLEVLTCYVQDAGYRQKKKAFWKYTMSLRYRLIRLAFAYLTTLFRK